MHILELNDYCLLRICRYFDAESFVTVTETCSKLKNTVEGFFKFNKSYKCYISKFEDEIAIVKTLRKVGKHLTKIDLKVEITYQWSIEKFLKLLATSVGPNCIELSIFGGICSMPLKVLDPILLHLEVLTLQNSCSKQKCVSKIDLTDLCPNLRKLTVCGKIIFEGKTFPKLKSLDVIFDSQQTIEEVLKHNRQIEMLNLQKRGTCNSRVNFTFISHWLRDLVKLQFDVQLVDNLVVRLPSLSNLQFLHSLELYSIPAALFNDILNILETLDRLRNIVLQCKFIRLDPNFLNVQESFARIARNLKELRSFVTIEVDWTEDSVEKFVLHAQKLIYFDFWCDSNYIITPESIRNLARIRRILPDDAGTNPLHLKLFRMDNDLQQVFNETDVASIIKLAK